MKILFIYPKSCGFGSFIEKDAKILASQHEIYILPYARTRYDLASVLNQVRKHELVFNWFCGLHAVISNLAAKLLNKKTVTVVGGYEVASVPDINYGQFANRNHRFITTLGLKLSDLVINISKYSQKDTIKNAGIYADKTRMIYHGFSEKIFRRDPNIQKKKNLVITIAKIDKMSLIRKGLDTFVKSAAFLPEVDFLLIGPDLDGSLQKLKDISPANVKFAGGLYGKDLSKVCNRAKAYVQASIYESFGCSVAEAMLCGCIPVISNNSALPEVVGDVGINFETQIPEDLAKKIKVALAASSNDEKKVIERIRINFALEKRQQSILSEVWKLKNK